jgi:hypothetical protein
MSAPYQTSVPAITGRSPTITTTLPAAARVPADSFLVPLYSLPVLGFGFTLGSLPLLNIQNHTKTYVLSGAARVLALKAATLRAVSAC